ncbi:MAG: cell division protein FtsK [Gemmatimonadetes bacterium]|nr:cell division protein FtsK [Gemmatimonadota bacterium]NIO30403.1 cell division protein FtsK [Gemmatimonadota bacterium]
MGDREDDRTQRILIGIGLIAVGLFTLLSVVPVELFGAGARGLFPSGNIAGPVGAAVAGTLVGSFGVSAAVVPLLPIVWGIWSLGRIERSETGRWTLFFAILLALVPPLLACFAYPAGGGAPWLAGGYGLWAGGLLAGLLGWVGGALVLLVFLIVGVILILGLEPFRALARGTVRGADVTRRSWTALVRAAAAFLNWSKAAGRRIGAGWEWVNVRLVRRESRGLLSGIGASEEEKEPEPAALEPPPPPAPPSEKEKKKRRDPQTWLFGDGAGDLPPLELLQRPPDQEYRVSPQTLDELGATLVDTLRTFKVEGEISGRTTGPVVTQFEVVPASGVKVGKIAALADDLALALKAPSIRIIAPIPGKGAVGVEVPNPQRKIVYLREILESSAYASSRAELPLALGEDVRGRSDVYDLAKMPHLLIAGVTGSGKSVCINAIISSLIYRYQPEELRLLLIDPKMVELGGYNVLPHLRHPVVTDNRDAATVLKWLVYEMERRYEWLSSNGCRNLREYNRRVSKGMPITAPGSEGGEPVDEPETKPYIVLFIDELADLMMTVQNEVERPLAYLAQKARATGIHLVVATQRPSVNVITGLIKANFPCRIAFRVASKVDSRTIIDQNGAETLLGNGDMLFMPPGGSEPVRIQGTFVSTEDTERLTDWYRVRAEAAALAAEEENILDAMQQIELEEAEAEIGSDELEDRDPLFKRAAEVVIQHQQGSTSLLQRRLKIGYGRAARIVDQLEHAGIVGPPEGSKPREVLVTLQDLDRI